MNICVFGAASDLIDKYYTDTAEKLGEMIGKRGHNLVFGAGNNGMMGAVARGVKKENRHITGVIPDFFKEERIEQIYNQCDELIYTETMAQRKSKMEDLADAFIVVPGGVGTFEEMFEIITLKQLGRHTKPIALYDINDYYDKLEDFLAHSQKQKFIREECSLLYFVSDDAKEILDYIENDKRIKIDVHELKNG